MGGTTERKGPDLRAGVPLAEVPDGGLLAAQVDGEPVVLHRRGSECFAIGGVCSHYAGPLAEGLVVGDTIRCPWHHACYDVRTGEVVGAPGLAGVGAYELALRDGMVHAVGLRAPAPRSVAGGPTSVVIIGAGAAGTYAALTLRQLGYAGAVTLIDAADDLPYDKPNLSKDYLAGNAPEEWIPLRPAEFYEEQRIALKLGRRVESIDPTARRVTLADGQTIEYGALLLATGAVPIALPGAVVNGPVHYLRTWADSRRLIEQAKSARQAVVLGASFIGLEVAASLIARGLQVDVVAPEHVPLERVLGMELGEFVRDLHAGKGVRFHLGHTAGRIEQGHVVLDDGSRLDADLVVAGIGVRPHSSLAASAGLEADNGIAVDANMRTAVPGIWVAGDLARFPYFDDRIRVEHWVVAQRQGALAAHDMVGIAGTRPLVPFFWSAHYDVTIAYAGHGAGWDRIEVEGSPAARDVAVRYYRSDRLAAMATIFRDVESLAVEAQIEHMMIELQGSR